MRCPCYFNKMMSPITTLLKLLIRNHGHLCHRDKVLKYFKLLYCPFPDTCQTEWSRSIEISFIFYFLLLLDNRISLCSTLMNNKIKSSVPCFYFIPNYMYCKLNGSYSFYKIHQLTKNCVHSLQILLVLVCMVR